MRGKLAVVMDPIADINYKKDSTLAILLAAQARGWALHYIEMTGLYLVNGEAMALVRDLEVRADPDDWFTLGEATQMSLGKMDVILMRKDPPFDNEYIYSSYILEAAERRGALVVNRPASLRDCNEKVFATEFPQCCPPVLVSRNDLLLREFHREYGDVIFKPLDGMGGSSVFRVRQDDPNVSVIIETLTQHNSIQIMAQTYLPQILDGDKRILLIDGEPAVAHALARIPAPNETRGNLAAGATARVQPLTARDQWICEQVGPTLKEKGLIFVGLDIIGDHLTEINVTSPTCIRELDDTLGSDIGGKLMDCIAAKLAH